MIIGAVVGTYMGGTIANNDYNPIEWNYSSSKTWGFMAAGGAIGGASGLAGAGIGMAGGAAWWSGAAAGAISGAGFSGLAFGGDWNAILQGGLYGAISGFVGGALGSAIGGGAGAFFGGVASNFTNQMLYNNGDIEKINWLSVGFAGVSSYGMYHAMTYASYKWGGGKDWSYKGQRITYRQYKTMQADFQRSRFWRKEYGGVLTNDGGVVRVKIENRHSLHVDFTDALMAANEKGGVLTHYHTHWAKPGITYQLNSNYDITAGGVYDAPASFGPSQGDLSFAATHGNGFLIDRTNFYIYNNIRGIPYYGGGGFLRHYFPIFDFGFINSNLFR